MKNLLTLTLPGSDGRRPEILPPENIPTLAQEGPFSFGGIMEWILAVTFIIIILATFGYLIYGGFMWMTSQGDKQKVESARKIITYSIVGLIVSLSSIVIVRAIGIAFGADLLNPFGK